MVAKISVGSSLFGALSYNQNKVDEQQGKVLLSNRMFESEDGNFSIRRCMECFDMHLPADLKTEKPIIHISLNPHPDDVLSDSQLADIAKEYMDKLGYGNQPYMVYKHEDIARHHIHIVSIRVDDTGKKINDKFEHIRSKQITRELEGVVDPLPADAPQFVKDYHAYYKTPRGYHKRSLNSNHGWNKTSPLSFINMPILSYSDEIRSAVLMLHGEKAHSRYFSEDAFKKLQGDNKELLIIPGANHVDLYDNIEVIPFGKIERFFNEHLR